MGGGRIEGFEGMATRYAKVPFVHIPKTRKPIDDRRKVCVAFDDHVDIDDGLGR
jgi:hypothetical protein